MNVTEVIGQARDAISVQRVFGAPIEKNGVMVIPVARVMGGAGGGGEDERVAIPIEGAPGGTEVGATAAAAGGMGFGMLAGPAGAYVIKGDEVQWRPAYSIERLTAIGGLVGILVLLILRSMLRIVVRS